MGFEPIMVVLETTVLPVETIPLCFFILLFLLGDSSVSHTFSLLQTKSRKFSLPWWNLVYHKISVVRKFW